MTDRKAKQTPLPDLLDRVPEEIVLGIPGDEPVFPSYTNIPIGKLAREAAAELRRLHELLEAEQTLHQRVIYPELQRLRAQRDALLEAYRKMKNVAAGYSNLCDGSAFTRKLEREFEAADAIARAAIKAVEGETK